MKKLEPREIKPLTLGLIVGGRAPTGVLAPRIVVQIHQGVKWMKHLHSQYLWKDTESVGNCGWFGEGDMRGQGTGVGERFNIH